MTDRAPFDSIPDEDWSEDRLEKCMTNAADDCVNLVLAGAYEEALETAKYFDMLRDEMNRR